MLLENINNPQDLKKLSVNQLVDVCTELRRFIIEQLSHNAGHFASSLGVVELTVALHYVFDTPLDKLVWDVGHQAYGHKILTGRRQVFHTNRKLGGISGFPNIFESPYDAFGVGHSSTSISAILGMATAAKLKGETKSSFVAVIGDGSMTGGEAFEALNNMSVENPNMLVILNDNNMSIDKATGALSQYLLDISTSRSYNRLRKRVAGNGRHNLFTKFTNSIKNLVGRQTNMFEGLNIRYFGPVDGHDVEYLVRVLTDLKNIPGPKLLHVITTKGKGFEAAQENPTKWHAVGGRFDIETGEKLDAPSTVPSPPKFQDVFGNTLLELAEQNPDIVGITPAMASGCSMDIMMRKMPNRVFDVGIAEQHAVTFSAGLAIQGLTPFCNIYSTFAQRAFDQIVHDVALQKLHVVFCFDRAGLVGADGATHHGAFDLAMLRPIPNMVICSPKDEPELRHMMFTAQLPQNSFPIAIRYPRGKGSVVDWKQPMHELQIGKGECLKEGSATAILALGPLAVRALKVAKSMENTESVAVYNMRFLKPVDKQILSEVFSKFSKIITLEDGALKGGLASAVIEEANAAGYKGTIKSLGLPDKFIEHGSVDELHKIVGLDEESIRAAILNS